MFAQTKTAHVLASRPCNEQHAIHCTASSVLGAIAAQQVPTVDAELVWDCSHHDLVVNYIRDTPAFTPGPGAYKAPSSFSRKPFRLARQKHGHQKANAALHKTQMPPSVPSKAHSYGYAASALLSVKRTVQKSCSYFHAYSTCYFCTRHCHYLSSTRVWHITISCSVSCQDSCRTLHCSLTALQVEHDSYSDVCMYLDGALVCKELNDDGGDNDGDDDEGDDDVLMAGMKRQQMGASGHSPLQRAQSSQGRRPTVWGQASMTPQLGLFGPSLRLLCLAEGRRSTGQPFCWGLAQPQVTLSLPCLLTTPYSLLCNSQLKRLLTPLPTQHLYSHVTLVITLLTILLHPLLATPLSYSVTCSLLTVKPSCTMCIAHMC